MMWGSDPGRTVESSWPPDPFTEPGPRFALAGTKTSLREDGTAEGPSEIGTRPWGLRRARPAGPGRPVPVWSYDDAQQLAVDAAGCPLVVTADGDPSADTTSRTDGEDGPSSEDWDND